MAQLTNASIDPVRLLLADIAAQRRRGADRRLVIGVCGAQGSGKTTLCADLAAALEREQSGRVAVLSIDDLYLPASERLRLAQQIHPLLRTRGVPGTHEVSLGIELVHALQRAGPTTHTPLPRFDKLSDERLPMRNWPRFVGSADVVLLEGWCVGARAQPASELAPPVNALEREEDREGRWRQYVNAQLAGPYQALFGLLDRLVLLRAPSFDVVFQWRRQQEHSLAAARSTTLTSASPGGVGIPRVMSDAQLERFIAHYERLTRFILEEMPARADIVFSLDAARRVREIAQRERLGPEP